LITVLVVFAIQHYTKGKPLVKPTEILMGFIAYLLQTLASATIDKKRESEYEYLTRKHKASDRDSKPRRSWFSR
jgi:hypothetical protein